ncbi:MAG: type II toxin-antitoxin system PemK/MazF family toxin [Acidobacteria bacterium]|nr:type II toxin-antitoxin system PemK/MazF family toxin [Acidobacteriota bacterium]MBI3427946.1 type II toxin-antitoxin system PemK/MazF family toxin [Acidobacteriota bacterium]
MKRGELYRVPKPTRRDPKRSRVFVIVSRQMLIDSSFSSVICAPVYSQYDGFATQVCVGVDAGLKHESSIHCDDLVSLAKPVLTNYIGALSPEKIKELNRALKAALELDEEVEDEI